MIIINPKMFICIAVKINPRNINETLKYIKATWNSVFPGVILSYNFLDEAYNNIYSPETKTGQLLSVFTSLAIFISCLGLLGFASFIVKKRIKEVGIRKVLGARISAISSLLSLQFLVWIVASSIIACPVAYILVKKWLGNFAFRIKIDWWVFLVAILIELIIALIIVVWISWKTATKNPVDALRYE